MTIHSTATSAPDTGSGACFAVSHDAELPATLGHVDGASPVPGAGTFFAVTSDSGAALPGHVTRKPDPPITTSTTPPAPSRVTDWEAELRFRFSESHLARLERRQLSNPYNEQHVHDLKRSDLDWDVVRTRLDEAKEHRKQRDVADAWRTHILEQRKGKTWEQRRHLDQVLKEGTSQIEGHEMAEWETGGQETGGQETGDRRQETGEQETGDRDRRQETGDRRQETGDRRQETGAGDRRWENGEQEIGRVRDWENRRARDWETGEQESKRSGEQESERLGEQENRRTGE
ncbi:hypothetical protein DEU56DRAFT_758776 [Suillus clintonianus]|uniref:uncharacterized protein n=1 Tax=Suillus clintonianus TaxID=1904413 RepID=UPI001B875F91|nr:uncharacterized protein DEU56DRAFT_758776 [Suillus clintonianus]KAG2126793.1 hypothetical protein DEU56DRAFT_758776 [Suillus clintonianus]